MLALMCKKRNVLGVWFLTALTNHVSLPLRDSFISSWSVIITGVRQ